MDLQSLDIKNFRGIKGEYTFEPDNGNAIIVGPNGSGKSSVLEAINYLLTNNIRQLSRPGMRGVKKEDVIGNVDADGDCVVSATFEEDSTDEHIEVQRSIDDSRLDPPQEDLPDSLNRVIETAQQGQHILTRDDLLDLIITQPQSRRDVLSELLNLPDIDDRRLSLQRTRKNLEDELEDAEAKRENTIERLQALADSNADEEHELRLAVLEEINVLRDSFGGDPIEEIDPESIREDLKSPLETLSTQALRRERPQEELNKFVAWLDRFEDELPAELELLESLLDDCKKRESDEVSANRLELLELGEEVIPPDSDVCPLCKQDWNMDKPLHEDVRRRRQELQEFQSVLDDLEEIQEDIIQHLEEGLDHITYLVKELEVAEYPEVEELERFDRTVKESLDALQGKLIQDRSFDPQELPICEPEGLEIDIGGKEIVNASNSLQSQTEELDDLGEAEKDYERIDMIAKRWQEYKELDDEAARLRSLIYDMETAEEAFIESRREVIGAIYEDITDRVESYYCSIHPDEDGTRTSIDVTETGATLQKEFYDAGEYPPHSVFSEGHLDSLGLCLHLALTDYLQHDEKSLLLLDDVVMSVDQDHRLQIARTIAQEFAEEYQIIITTHDELWAEQLRSQGALNGGSMVHLREWSIDDGVKESRSYIDVYEQWETVEEAMADDEMERAAHELRYATERMLQQTCMSIGGKVEYNPKGTYRLSDFRDAVSGRLNTLTGRAKANLNPPDQAEEGGEMWNRVEELESEFGKIINDVSQHLNKVNRRVHWSPGKWLTLSPAEFDEVFEAHKTAYNLLYCEQCGSSIRYEEFDGYCELRCNCREHYDIRWD